MITQPWWVDLHLNLLEAKVALLDGKIGLAAKMEDEETGDAWIKLARDVFFTWAPK